MKSSIYEVKDKFCGDCEYCTPKERDQTKNKEDHICKLYNVRLFHRNFHPKILKCSKCKSG